MSFGNPVTTMEKANRFFCSPIAWVWQLVVAIRLQLYKNKILKTKTVDCPVISVGNITSGGTGKTPIVIDIANQLIARGFTVGILSRGYKRRSKQNIVVVSDGKNLLSGSFAAGDEPYMIAQSAPRAIVIVGAKRKETAQLAVEKYKCNVLLLDDGFSHLALNRNQDIVLIDYFDDPAKNALLPAGRLREPLSSLSRATSIVITKIPEDVDADKLGRLKALLRNYAPDAEIGECRFEPSELRAVNCGINIYSPDQLAGIKAVAFCGIAKPESFFAMLEALKVDLVHTRVFPDHHWYSEEDISLIAKDIATTNAALSITTEKDFVRLDTHKMKSIACVELKTHWLTPITAINQLQLPEATS